MPRKKDAEEIPDLPAEKQQEVLRALPESVPDLGPVVAAEQQEASLLQSPSTLALLAGLGVLIAAVLWSVYPTLRPDERTPMLVFGILAGVLAVVCAVLAAAMASLPFYRRGTHWVLCREGLVRVRWGRWVDAFPWADLEIRKASANPAVREYEVGVAGKEPIKLTYGLFGGKLIRKIQDLQVRFVLPALLEAVSRGEQIKFGLLKVSREGLHYRKKTLPWEEVAPLEFTAKGLEGWVVTLNVKSLPDGDEWTTVGVAENLPNAWLFYELVTALEPRLGTKARQTANLRGWLA